MNYSALQIQDVICVDERRKECRVRRSRKLKFFLAVIFAAGLLYVEFGGFDTPGLKGWNDIHNFSKLQYSPKSIPLAYCKYRKCRICRKCRKCRVCRKCFFCLAFSTRTSL